LQWMNILFTSHRFSPDIGGIESHSEILAGHFASKGCRVVLATRSSDDSTTRKFPYPVLRRVGAKSLRQAFRNADIVYQNNIELGSLWPGILLRKPLVISIHTWMRGSDGRRRLVDLLKKLVIKNCSQVICVSDALRRDSFENAFVIPNPYDNRLFRKLKNSSRDKAIVFVGRLVSDKGADFLIEAFARLATDSSFIQACARKGVKWNLTIIGSGSEERSLRLMVAEKGLSEFVDFSGCVSGERLVSILNKHRVIVIPSRWREPFGMVALEGMACGCVPIGSDGGGLPDAIGAAGLTYTRGLIEALIGGLRRLFLDPNLIEGFCDKAEEHLAKHKIDVVCDRYLKILGSIVNK